MSDAYHQLLDATIAHLEGLKSRGVRFVNVSPASLAALTAPRLAQPPQRASAIPASTPTITAPRPVQIPVAPQSTMPKAPKATPAPATTVIPSGFDRAPLQAAEKESAFQALRTRTLACTKCAHLVASRTQVVFGVGDMNASLMFVGEAPGADEDEQGEPFVGKAGQLLTRIIQTMGLSREQVYIGNILKCRPDTPGQTAGNRKPTTEEMAVCFPYLQEQIEIIRPKVLVALGGTAVQGLLGLEVQITKFRGNWQSYRGIPVMPTYHPSYLQRNQSIALKRETWEDMLQVMERLGMEITEKHRSYFLSKT